MQLNVILWDLIAHCGICPAMVLQIRSLQKVAFESLFLKMLNHLGFERFDRRKSPRRPIVPRKQAEKEEEEDEQEIKIEQGKFMKSVV